MIIQGDCLEELKNLDADSIDFICTDPPYGIGFMGKEWDTFKPTEVAAGVARSSRKDPNLKHKESRDKGSAAMEAARYDHTPQGARRFREWFTEISEELLRVLKPGAFACVCIGARQDSVSACITAMTEAGFKTDFTSLYWTYASGFPKAGNIGKMVDKRNGRNEDDNREVAAYLKESRLAKGFTKLQMDELLGTITLYSWYEGRPKGTQMPTEKHYEKLKTALDLDDRYDELIKRTEAEREIIGKYDTDMGGLGGARLGQKGGNITTAELAQAKALDGSYAGYQPKPAVEVIIVAMKPLSEKTYVDQALKNGKGISWLDDCRLPVADTDRTEYGVDGDEGSPTLNNFGDRKRVAYQQSSAGRFPANLLVSDDVLNNGTVTKSPKTYTRKAPGHGQTSYAIGEDAGKSSLNFGDSGSYSRYFDLDKWAQTLPFLIVPKASKSEKNKGLGDAKNIHPTCKPLKLMSYLITMFSRPGDTILDPFAGSGTTCLAAKKLNRKYIGIEREAEYVEIAEARLAQEIQGTLL